MIQDLMKVSAKFATTDAPGFLYMLDGWNRNNDYLNQMSLFNNPEVSLIKTKALRGALELQSKDYRSYEDFMVRTTKLQEPIIKDSTRHILKWMYDTSSNLPDYERRSIVTTMLRYYRVLNIDTRCAARNVLNEAQDFGPWVLEFVERPKVRNPHKTKHIIEMHHKDMPHIHLGNFFGTRFYNMENIPEAIDSVFRTYTQMECLSSLTKGKLRIDVLFCILPDICGDPALAPILQEELFHSYRMWLNERARPISYITIETLYTQGFQKGLRELQTDAASLAWMKAMDSLKVQVEMGGIMKASRHPEDVTSKIATTLGKFRGNLHKKIIPARFTGISTRYTASTNMKNLPSFIADLGW